METEKLYKQVNNAGLWSFWLGVIQVVTIPLVIFVAYHTPHYTAAEREASAFVGSAFQLIFGTLLIIYGRKARLAISSDPSSLKRTAKARKVLLITLAAALLLAFVTGGRIGLLLLILLAVIARAHKASKILQSKP